MNGLAKVATIAMWVMIIALVLGFFIKSKWITVMWVAAAVVCLISVLLVGYNKKRNRNR